MATEESDTKVINGRTFKRRVVKPDKYGIVTVPDGWFADEIDFVTGEGKGWEPVK